MGFRLLCTGGTAQTMKEHGINVEVVRKIHEGRPNVLDYLANGTIDLIVNTPSGKGARTDEGRIRASAVSHGVPCITTLAGAARQLPPWNACVPAGSRFMRCRTCYDRTKTGPCTEL